MSSTTLDKKLSAEYIDACIEELQALDKYVNERLKYWQAMSTQHKEGVPVHNSNALVDLFWRESKNGRGQFVNKSQVPDWVHEIPDVLIGTTQGQYWYKLFESGVLYREMRKK